MSNSLSSDSFGTMHFLVVFVIASVVALGIYKTLTKERAEKMTVELTRIQSKTRNAYPCEQYALVALKDGWFPCYKCEIDSIFLYKDEVWKYGKTCNEEEGRYPSGLPVKGLRYKLEFTGTEKECLVKEKFQIYNYPNLPECLKRKIKLIRPAGNKIDR